jgi:hypothetical protein
MQNGLTKFIVLIGLIIAVVSNVDAQNSNNDRTDNNPPGYSADISKPTESFSAASNDTVTKESTSTASCDAQWQAYCRPIRECVEGDVIIPTKGNKIFSYLFNNDADTNATLSILGWKNKKCRIDFKEGSLVKSCTFNHRVLNELMSKLLNPDQFNPSSTFAQNLAGSC